MHTFLDKLVSQASESFNIKQRLKSHTIKSKWNPDIIISRDPGSGGRVIAKKIAHKLTWKLLDKEILTKLANKLNIPEEQFANIDEHTRNWFSDTFNMLFNPNYVSDILYIKHLKRLLTKSAKDGDVVIVGRGANHILPPKKCLRVRITASFATRAKNTFKYEKKTSLEDAVAWVKHVENKRTNFIRQYFGVNPYNPWHYDLILNTDHIKLNQARDLIIDAYLAKFPTERRRLKNKI